jgi:hydrogenase-4 membrane subunit HyfE
MARVARYVEAEVSLDVLGSVLVVSVLDELA